MGRAHTRSPNGFKVHVKSEGQGTLCRKALVAIEQLIALGGARGITGWSKGQAAYLVKVHEVIGL